MQVRTRAPPVRFVRPAYPVRSKALQPSKEIRNREEVKMSAATSALDLVAEDVTEATWTELTITMLRDADDDGETSTASCTACDSLCDGCDSSTHHIY
jgi:hypothetical protein